VARRSHQERAIRPRGRIVTIERRVEMARTTTAASRVQGAVRKATAKSEKELAKRRARLEKELDSFATVLAGKVSDVRAAIATAADEGAAAATRGLDAAIQKSRKGVRQLEKRWKKMDTRQKAGVVGGLLAAIAAAAAAPALIRKARGR
jgi:hypothetical protein